MRTIEPSSKIRPATPDGLPRQPAPGGEARRCEALAGRSHRLFLLAVTACVAALFLWSSLTVLDKVKRGSGRVIPVTQNQIVQHLEGGIVSDIFVREGARVERGAPLLRVQNSFSEAELRQTRLDIRAKRIRLARLQAEIAGADDFAIPAGLADGVEAIVASERQVFAGTRKVLDEQIAIIGEGTKQKELELETLKARWTSTQAEREIVVKQVTSHRRLAAIGALAQNELLDSERALQQVEARISDLAHDIPRTESELAETGRRATELRLKAKIDAENDKVQTELDIAKLEQAVVALSDRNIRSDVLAPIAGTVNKLFVSTVGGVVKSGEPLAQIVPDDGAIAVEARLSPSDRAEVWPGLPAVVKISAYDSSIYGGLKGKVTEISSDALQDERGQPYFRVRLEADSHDFGKDRPVLPGMVAEIDILAGKQTVLDAILRPVRLLRDNALRL